MAASLEECTNRRIGMLFDEDEAFGRYDEQDASPLFTILPREIRDLIWAYATSPFEDPDGKFEETAYYYRPGHTARLKTNCTLLLTCRQAFLEANALPMLQAEHSFYYHRAAPDARNHKWMASLTAHNRQNFGHLHMFAQMCNIEPLDAELGSLRSFFLKTPAVHGDFQPRMLHVTIRHTDWWWWESETPLRLEDHWVTALLNSPDLRSTHVLKLELETLDYKVVQLEPIVERIKKLTSKVLETHIVDGKRAKTQFQLADSQDVYTWEGPSSINKQKFQPYAGKDRLKYHVVTLTWRLRFPDIPSAFIPRLRRAQRITATSERSADAINHHGDDDYTMNSWIDGTMYNTPLELIYVARQLPHYGYEVGDVRAWRKRRYGSSRRGDTSGAGLNGSSHDHRRLQVSELNVRDVLQNTGKRTEDAYRRLFHAGYGGIYARLLENKWDVQKSLLNFVD